MGRALPELQMCTFFIYGLPAAPAALCDIRHNVVLFDEVRDAFWLERMARAVTIQMGCHAAYAMAPWRGAEIKRTAVLYTVTQARAIGAVVLEARRMENPIPPLVASQGEGMFEGKIVDVLRRVTGGFACGEVTIEGLDDSRASTSPSTSRTKISLLAVARRYYVRSRTSSVSWSGIRDTDQYRTATLWLSRCGRGISGASATDQRPGSSGRGTASLRL